MAKFYPRKQTLFITLLCTIAVAGTALYVHGKKTEILENKAVLLAQNNIYETPVVEISTSTDWRKQFFGTSTATTKIKIASKPAQTSDEPETLTEQFGKDFFAQFMFLKQNNQIDNADAVKTVIDQSVEGLIGKASSARVYDIRNLTLSLDSSVTAEKTYANTVGTLLSTYLPREDAATIATDALENKDEMQIQKIKVIADAYDTIAKKLLTIPTPQSLTSYQVDLLNGVSEMSFVSKGMGEVFTDPVKGLFVLATYEQSVQDLYDALLNLKFHFSTQGFQFSDNEPGAFFTQIK